MANFVSLFHYNIKCIYQEIISHKKGQNIMELAARTIKATEADAVSSLCQLIGLEGLVFVNNFVM